MKTKIYEGSSKILYKTEEKHLLTMAFTDKIRLKDGKTLDIFGKGVINNAISSFIMQKLDLIGVENHFVDKVNMREQVVQLVEMLPVQIYVSNIACDRYVEQFGMQEGYVFDTPIIDYRIKNKELNYPIINEHQIITFGWILREELLEIKNKSLRIFSFLSGLFAAIDIRLVSCCLEFGRVFYNEDFATILADEITPDSCGLWDMSSNEKLGIEAIKEDNKDPIKSYQIILDRFNISPNKY